MAPSRRPSLLAAAAALALGCTGATLNDLQRDASANGSQSDVIVAPPDDAAADAGAPGADVQSASDVVVPRADAVSPTPVDAPSTSMDVVIPPPMDVVIPPPMDVVTPPPVDVVTPPPVDVVTPPPVDVVTPRPDVVTPRPDVVTPPDRPVVCEVCMPFAPVEFCRGTGAGACLSYAGCADGCSVCAAPVAGGDRCSNAHMIATRGRSRSVFTTCGATDNLSIGCNRSGVDIAVTLRVMRTARTAARITVPEGVGVFFGFDATGGTCRDQSSTRVCNNATPQRSQGFDQVIGQGDWTLYIATTAPSTVVIETELP